MHWYDWLTGKAEANYVISGVEDLTSGAVKSLSSDVGTAASTVAKGAAAGVSAISSSLLPILIIAAIVLILVLPSMHIGI